MDLFDKLVILLLLNTEKVNGSMQWRYFCGAIQSLSGNTSKDRKLLDIFTTGTPSAALPYA